MQEGYLATRKEGNTCDLIWLVPPFGYGSEREWLHIIACRMNYANEECADMHINLVEARRNSAKGSRLYAGRFPSCQISGLNLNTNCELVHLYSLILLSNKLYFLRLSAYVIPVFLKRQRPLLQTGVFTVTRLKNGL
jgi:hypothetical protein